jgi:hypothetical protein
MATYSALPNIDREVDELAVPQDQFPHFSYVQEFFNIVLHKQTGDQKRGK